MSSKLRAPSTHSSDWEALGIEAERYELHAAALHDFTLTRRNLLKLAGAGLIAILLIDAAPDSTAQESGQGRRRGGGQGQPKEIAAWIHVGVDGTVTAYTGKVEVGQNIRTSLAQGVAEELRVPLASVRMVMGDTAETPFDMGTFGSQTTPSMFPQMRRAAAAAREALIGMAVDKWSVKRDSLSAADGSVKRTDTGETVKYGALTEGRKFVTIIEGDVNLTPATEWKTAGQAVRKTDGRDIVTGAFRYASDIHVPGQFHGKILRPAGYGGELVSLDSSAAEKMNGVKVVRDGNFVGVVAPSAHVAAEALDTLKAEWKVPAQPSSKEIFTVLRNGAQPPASEPDAISATYNVAYIAHTPMEPRAAVAFWEGDKLTVWTGTQRPFGVRSELAQAFGIPEANVHVNMPGMGSGYGGKHTGEAAVEAARLAKAAGKPVKLVWTRAEEFSWAYFRPAGVIDVKAKTDANGKLTTWEFHNYNSGGAGLRSPYTSGDRKEEFHQVHSPLRQGSYRALASTANNFARETHMNTLAHALKLDPVELRHRNLDNDRIKAVLDASADKFGWSRRKAADSHGFGIACGTEKGGFVSTAAEVAADRATGKVRVVRLVTAFECGAIVNPDGLRNQIEGAMMMGIGGALFERITFENGKLQNGTMTQYRVPRFSDMPIIEVVLVDRKDLPSSGAGECPIICVAPAIAEAIFQATGKRLTDMPLMPG
jgi:nicotinate dehydrogenase subunit B